MVKTVKSVVAFLSNFKILVAFMESVQYFGERLEYYYPETPSANA